MEFLTVFLKFKELLNLNNLFELKLLSKLNIEVSKLSTAVLANKSYGNFEAVKLFSSKNQEKPK